MQKKLFIKICGITQAEDAKFAVDIGADAIGFIAFPKSLRYIDADSVSKICTSLKSKSAKGTKKTGVFVDTDIDFIKTYIDAGIEIIQLHGNENAKFAEECSKLAEVWKVIKPQSTEDIAKFANFPADKFLLDTFHKDLHGGSGITMELKLAQFAVKHLQKPVILAGGLSPDNVTKIVKMTLPFGIDVNSGVESSPGVKDHTLIQKLFQSQKESNQK